MKSVYGGPLIYTLAGHNMKVNDIFLKIKLFTFTLNVYCKIPMLWPKWVFEILLVYKKIQNKFWGSDYVTSAALFSIFVYCELQKSMREWRDEEIMNTITMLEF